MITINRQAIQVGYYAIGLTATKLVSLLILPITTRFLNPTEFGNLEILLTFINLATVVLGFGLTEALFRFGGMAKTHDIMNTICANASTMALLIGVILCSPLILFPNQIASLLPGSITRLQIIYLGLALIPCNILSVQLDWLRLKEDVVQFIWVSFLRSLLQAILLLIVLYAGLGVTGIMFATALTTSITLSYFLLFQLSVPLQFNMKVQKQLFFFGLPLSFSGLAEFILMSLSNWWIAYDAGPANMALFALAMKFAMITSFIIQPFYMWWDPRRYKHLETEIARKYTASMSELGVTLCFLGAYVVMITSSVFILWFIPSNYHQAIAYLPFACFILTTKYAGDMMNTGLFLRRPNHIMYINSTMAVLTIIGFYFFIPMWHVWGALWVLQFTLLLRWIAYVYLSQRELFLPYRYIKLISFIVMTGICGISTHWIKSTMGYFVVGGGLCILQMLVAYRFELLPHYKKIFQ